MNTVINTVFVLSMRTNYNSGILVSTHWKLALVIQ